MTDEQLALLRTMRYGVLMLRDIGYQGQREGLSLQQSEIVADIADAIHNIPDALESNSFDLEFHTEIMLGGLAKKYKESSDVPHLLNHYKSNLFQIKKEE